MRDSGKAVLLLRFRELFMRHWFCQPWGAGRVAGSRMAGKMMPPQDEPPGPRLPVEGKGHISRFCHLPSGACHGMHCHGNGMGIEEKRACDANSKWKKAEFPLRAGVETCLCSPCSTVPAHPPAQETRARP